MNDESGWFSAPRRFGEHLPYLACGGGGGMDITCQLEADGSSVRFAEHTPGANGVVFIAV
jgi:hypothetical protein